MSKYYGKIGFAVDTETAKYVYEQPIVERYYYGDINRNMRRWENGQHLNDNLNTGNEISILADPFAYQHFYSIRWAEFMGSKWKVTSAEVDPDRPRLKLQLGGLYNEDES